MSNDGMTRVLRAAAVAALGLCTMPGCSLFHRDAEPQPVSPDQFASHRVEGRSDRDAIDRPGQVIVEGVRPPEEDPARQQQQQAASASRVRSVNDITPAVREAARAPGETSGPGSASARGRGPSAATTRRTDVAIRPTTAPVATTAPGTGQYVMLGKVLAQVNGRPIYAHKVLAVLDNALRAEAQRYDERGFRRIAQDLIVKEIQTEVNEELIFAVAEKALDAKEKQVAEQLTAQWKNEQVTNAGGSLELARRRWTDEGWDFDERLDYQYRVSMKLVFLQRRIYPLLHVTASDIRHYYEANKDTEFTKPARVKFRVIKIDPQKMHLEGGADAARQLAERIRVKAFKGDFAQLARETNDEGLKLTAGQVGPEGGWMLKGTYIDDKVDDAVWKLQPGQVTDVIEDKGAFYVAKLEDKQEAVSQDFEDLAVQQEIDGRLRTLQLRELEQRRQAELRKEAVIQENPQMMEVAVDMAMQRYPAWAAAGKRATAADASSLLNNK
jgi:parvulin-like peptidyl-prolyl isomerase